MKLILVPAILVCVLLVCGPAMAADPAAPAAVLKMIPADALGYIVVNNIKAATDNVDAYIKEIGLANDVAAEMPQGCLSKLLKECRMEEGLNSGGGAALVMLDPVPLGVNLLSMLIPAAAPSTGPSGGAEVPYAILLPAAGIKPLLAAYDVQDGKPYAKVSLSGEEFYVGAANGYVVMSPNAKAVDAVINAPKKADAELSADQIKLIASATVAAQMNCKAAGPMAQRMLSALNLAVLAARASGGSVPYELREFVQMRPSITQMIKSLNEMDRLIVTVQPAKAGIVARCTMSYLPDTPGAKEVAACVAATAAAPQALLDSVPDLRYTMAGGMVLPKCDAPSSMITQVDAILQAVKEIKPRRRAQLVAWLTKAQQEVNAIQFVMNQNEEATDGTINMALVLKCQDPAKLQDILAEGVKLADEIGREVIAAGSADPNSIPPADPNDPAVKYTKAAGKVGDVTVDTIEADCPINEAQTLLGIMLGESRFRAMVAPAGPKSLVISMGGGTAAMEKNLAAAKKLDGKILASPEAKQCLEHLGPNLQAVFVLNVGNYVELVAATMSRAVGGGMGEIPTFKCKSPLTAGVSVEGGTRTITLFVPTDMVKDICDTFHHFSGRPGGSTLPPPKAEDF